MTDRTLTVESLFGDDTICNLWQKHEKAPISTVTYDDSSNSRLLTGM